MTVYQLMGQYEHDRGRALPFTSHVHTDNLVFADELHALLTADLLTLLLDADDLEDFRIAEECAMHGDDPLVKFYVQPFVLV